MKKFLVILSCLVLFGCTTDEPGCSNLCGTVESKYQNTIFFPEFDIVYYVSVRNDCSGRVAAFEVDEWDYWSYTEDEYVCMWDYTNTGW